MLHPLETIRKVSLQEKLEGAKAGNTQYREQLIQEYIPFIIKAVSNTTHRYIERENSPEYILGLEAFNEAIDKFNPDKGKFISFASLVIRNKVIDYMRKVMKENNIISINQLTEIGDESEQCNSDIEDLVERIDLKKEIIQLESVLKQFKISFSELSDEAPKHRDTRVNALHVAKYIAKNDMLKQEMFSKKRLPREALIKDLGVTKKAIDRSRKFIIVSVIILDSNLEVLKNYISEVIGGD